MAVKTKTRGNGQARYWGEYPDRIRRPRVSARMDPRADVVLHRGDAADLLRRVTAGSVRLVVTSPPYNIGKPYERRSPLDAYLASQEEMIRACHRALAPDGSICWQVGNYVEEGEVLPLDIPLHAIFKRLGMRLRNRIIWHFEHGLHCSRRFSGRYETILWFTKGDDYVFNLDAVRVPQKYPAKKHYKGPNRGKLSCNPLGKNPGDAWVIPNVKHNHVEKTAHPCQFPVELVERLVCALTRPGDVVLDPYMGVGSTAVAAILNGRRAIGAEVVAEYLKVARARVRDAAKGSLRVRPPSRPIYEPPRG